MLKSLAIEGICEYEKSLGIAPLTLERYSPNFKKLWDDWVAGAVNQHVLFLRGFMDYHAERFTDHSLLAFRGGRLVGVLPANEAEGVLYSHQGLTFGGLLYGPKTCATDVLAFVVALRLYMQGLRLRRFICKPAPFAYVSSPCEALQYALHCAGARLLERHLATAIDFHNPIPMAELRRRGVKKALKAGVEIVESGDWEGFVSLLSGSLERHGTGPKHTPAELRLLKSRFPDHIRLMVATSSGTMLAGVLLFLTNTAAHTQYISVSPEGQRLGALDLLMYTVIEEQRPLRRYFCFGVSTENAGGTLNYGLHHQKEGFGGRAMLHDIYELGA